MALEGGTIDPPRPRRRESKQARREQLIAATIDVIAARGYSGTTLADVADRAGLSRGIVNFHFESKDKLFVETLNHMSEEYTRHWRQALDAAGPEPAAQLRALIVSDLDEEICNPRMISVWFAFWAEAATRPAYQPLCWAHDVDYLAAFSTVIARLKAEADYSFNVERTATALYALQEGLWMRLMFSDQSYTREVALGVALATLGSLFPQHFENDGRLRQDR